MIRDDVLAWALNFARSRFEIDIRFLLPGSATLNMARVLMSIGVATLRKDLVGVTEVSKMLHLPRSTVSRITIELIRRRLVCDTRDEEDRRRHYLEMTPVGLQAVRKWAEQNYLLRQRVQRQFLGIENDPQFPK